MIRWFSIKQVFVRTKYALVNVNSKCLASESRKGGIDPINLRELRYYTN